MRGIEGRGIGGFKGISPTSLSWVQRSKPRGHAAAVRGLLLFVPPVPCVKAICFQGLHQKGSTVCEGGEERGEGERDRRRKTQNKNKNRKLRRQRNKAPVHEGGRQISRDQKWGKKREGEDTTRDRR